MEPLEALKLVLIDLGKVAATALAALPLLGYHWLCVHLAGV